MHNPSDATLPEGRHELALLPGPRRGDGHPSKLDGSSIMELELRSMDPGGRLPGIAVETPVLTGKGTFGRLLSS